MQYLTCCAGAINKDYSNSCTCKANTYGSSCFKCSNLNCNNCNDTGCISCSDANTFLK